MILLNCNYASPNASLIANLIGVGEPTHSAHDSEHIVVRGVDTDLGSSQTTDGGGRHNQLECGGIDSGHVARATGLVLLRAQGEGVHVDTSVGATGVVLVWLHQVEVGSLTLGESVLSIELELGGNHGVLSPAMHVEGGLGQHEGTSIRYTRVLRDVEVGERVRGGTPRSPRWSTSPAPASWNRPSASMNPNPAAVGIPLPVAAAGPLNAWSALGRASMESV